MGKYYVKKDKLKRLEKLFQADIRWLREHDMGFDMTHCAVWRENACEWKAQPLLGSSSPQKCGACIVAAHVLHRRVAPTPGEAYQTDIVSAAKSLRVKLDWLRDLYSEFGSNVGSSAAKYPQAAKLSRRLQNYARRIGAVST